MKERIRHLYPHDGALQIQDLIPRGWITSEGQFFKTKDHWASINSHFRRPDARSRTRDKVAEEAAASDRTAQLAYSLGWISLGHAGKLNAIAHERTFEKIIHPATLTLRELLKEMPYHSIEIETQIGDYNPSKGVHEDYELREYDLTVLIRRGRLVRVR
jgi:hypothetical protein